MAYANRKQDGNVFYAQRKGQYGTTDEGCCCGVCTTAWKAVPCYAGECEPDVCDCPSCYPTLPIYVCTDATCGCGPTPIPKRGTILASYRFAPNVKWCFTVLNDPTQGDETFNIADLPTGTTIVGQEPFCVDCMGTCANPDCPTARGRFILPRACDTDNAVCPWICAFDVTHCDVELFGDFPNTHCCHFIGGPLAEEYFDDCPNPVGHWDNNGVSTCCECESDCGGFISVSQDTCDSNTYGCVCPHLEIDPLTCCCGAFAVRMRGRQRYDFVTGEWEVITSDCIKTAQQTCGTCTRVFTYSNQPSQADTETWCPDCINADSFWADVNQFCIEGGVGGDGGVTIATGAKTWTCDFRQANYTLTTTYPDHTVRKFTNVASATYTRILDPRCTDTCAGTGSGGVIQGGGVQGGGGLGRPSSSGDFL